MYRNSILALNTYKELSNKNIDELDKIIRDKKSLDKERLQIENFYKQTLNNSFGQMTSLFQFHSHQFLQEQKQMGYV